LQSSLFSRWRRLKAFQVRKIGRFTDDDAADTGVERVVKEEDWAPTLSAGGCDLSGAGAIVSTELGGIVSELDSKRQQAKKG